MKATIMTMAIALLLVQSGIGATLDAQIATAAGPVNAPESSTVFSDTVQIKTGRWRLMDSVNNSQPIKRYLEKKGGDSGIASAVNIFTVDSSATHTFKLQHQIKIKKQVKKHHSSPSYFWLDVL